jgi:hypothetical protein
MAGPDRATWKPSGGTLVAMNDNAQRPGRGADDDSAVDGPGSRLAAYEARTEKGFDLLALLTLWIVVVPPWDFGHDVEGIAWTIRIAVSVVYGIDLAIRGVHDILTNNKLFASNATGLLATGEVIWATNVIAFALWYWDLDRGGAAARAHHPQANPAFIFPEMLHTQYVPAPWVPKFVDYLSLGFWTATAFSPTDISAIRPWAKLLMITEAAVSLGIAGLVIARAINILA